MPAQRHLIGRSAARHAQREAVRATKRIDSLRMLLCGCLAVLFVLIAVVWDAPLWVPCAWLRFVMQAITERVEVQFGWIAAWLAQCLLVAASTKALYELAWFTLPGSE